MAQGIGKTFGERLRKLREDKGLTQAQLANELNISRAALGYYENGRTPTIDTLDLVSSYFDVPLDYLMGRTEAAQKKNVPICNDLGITEKSVENIRAITQNGNNIDILLEYDKLNDIVELLNQICIIAIIKRYFHSRINSDFRNDNTIQSTLNSSGEAFAIFSSSIIVPINALLKDKFNLDIDLLYLYSKNNRKKSNPDKSFMDKNYDRYDDKYLDEKLVFAEYKFTEHIIRNMINSIKQSNEYIDNKAFKEFDYLICENLTLKTAVELSLYGKAPRMSDDIKDELQALTRLQSYFKKTYGKKDGDPNG